MPEPVILFQNFSFQYHAQAEPSLVDINLAIYPGEKVLIAGPSGSGKSTLANCLNGLIPFNYKGEITGTCKVAGVETKEQSVFELSKIVGTVLQDTDGQFVGLTAGEDIAFSLENNCVSQDEMFPLVLHAANKTGLGDAFLKASPFDLSGGQKQRVSMAGIIVEPVQILLFDEPLASLDPATGKHAIDLIDNLKDETNTTVIIIEHRIEDVLYRNVDRIIVMGEGQILADMSPETLLCSDLLQETGLREPLYISAIKYAGIQLDASHRPERIDTLTLTDSDRAAIKHWYQEYAISPRKEPAKELLRVEGLHFSYNEGKSVIEDVGFAITSGEMTAIVGTNGAGKSTLAKLICGFETPDSGRVLLKDKDITTESIANRAKYIGYVMQNPNQMICKPLIFDEVAFGLRNQGVSEAEVEKRVYATLEICGLYQFRKWPVSALSYGQKKRVTIASVLVMEPEIIILDEPTAGQDYRHYTEIMEFLRELQGRGVTILLITHDMHLMLEYAPRALVFSAGQLLADMSSAALLCNPELSAKSSLKETSLFYLATQCGINDPAAFTTRFINYEGRA
ncbi:MAG: ABC transporter ATP-binding protein [Defluviitaleaceae bacterium]|nr:ABC transporter ATP-binding protein [Defluviitaleaceae bacterium]